jgi:hypothetical protein
MSKSLSIVLNEPNQSAIDVAKKVLQMCEDGEIVALSVCYLVKGGLTGGGWSAGDYNPYVLYGKMCVLARDFSDKEIRKNSVPVL